MNLFDEMDEIAGELHAHPKYGPGDDQIAFRQLQRIRVAKLNRGMEWLNLFAVWHDRYRARQEVKAAETRARVAALLEERDALFSERASASPDAISRIDARLTEIGNEIAASFEARDGHTVATLP